MKRALKAASVIAVFFLFVSGFRAPPPRPPRVWAGAPCGCHVVEGVANCSASAMRSMTSSARCPGDDQSCDQSPERYRSGP